MFQQRDAAAGAETGALPIGELALGARCGHGHCPAVNRRPASRRRRWGRWALPRRRSGSRPRWASLDRCTTGASSCNTTTVTTMSATMTSPMSASNHQGRRARPPAEPPPPGQKRVAAVGNRGAAEAAGLDGRPAAAYMAAGPAQGPAPAAAPAGAAAQCRAALHGAQCRAAGALAVEGRRLLFDFHTRGRTWPPGGPARYNGGMRPARPLARPAMAGARVEGPGYSARNWRKSAPQPGPVGHNEGNSSSYHTSLAIAGPLRSCPASSV